MFPLTNGTLMAVMGGLTFQPEVIGNLRQNSAEWLTQLTSVQPSYRTNMMINATTDSMVVIKAKLLCTFKSRNRYIEIALFWHWKNKVYL